MMSTPNDAHWYTEPDVDMFCTCGNHTDDLRPCTTKDCPHDTCRGCDDGTGLCVRCKDKGL